MATICCNAKTFESIQAVIFDKDGTLANSEEFLQNLAQRRARLIDAQIPGVQEPLLMAFGVDGNRIDPAGLMAVGTRLENEIAAAAYVAETGKGWEESRQIVRSAMAEADRYLPDKAAQTPVMQGAVELLQQLAKAGIRLAVLSSDSAANVKEFVGLLQCDFRAACGVDQTHPTKSDPGLLKQLFAALDSQPQHSLMIGDSLTDVQIAHSSGMAGCIGFTGGWSARFSLMADVTIDRFEQVKIED